jgi:hypothetical protein
MVLLLLEYYSEPEHLETYLIKETRHLLLLQDRVAGAAVIIRPR